MLGWANIFKSKLAKSGVWQVMAVTMQSKSVIEMFKEPFPGY